jgi:very-short-patch-repair endonuclease
MITNRSREYYETEYDQKERSPLDIAKEHGTYPNKIRRELIKYGFILRDKSEAQSLALKYGRHKHPTRNQKRPDNVKIKISNAMAKNWDDMSETEKNRRINMGKDQWAAMPNEEKAIMQHAATEAVRKASREGSKLEKFLRKALHDSGYEVLFHIENIIPNEKLQVDLFIPELKTVIEIDGPSHFYPIWGEENLARNIASDDKKNKRLLTYGYIVLRIKYVCKTLSEKHKRKVLEEILKSLESFSNNFPTFEKRLVEIEVK